MFTSLFTLTLLFQNCGDSLLSAGHSDQTQEQELSPQFELIQVDDMTIARPVTRSENTGDKVVAMQGHSHYYTTLWDSGDLIYEFDSSVSPDQRNRFLRACEEVTAFAGVRCIERSGQEIYIKIVTDETGCGSSYLGQPYYTEDNFPKGNGENTWDQYEAKLKMSSACWQVPGITEHELLHAFGVNHEHQRYDRDEYVDLIDPNNPSNSYFKFQPPWEGISEIQTRRYDYESVMHYKSYMGNKRVLWKKGYDLSDPEGEIQYMNYMSQLDHRTLYRMYENRTTNRMRRPNLERYEEYIANHPVDFILNCTAESGKRVVCIELEEPFTYEVLSKSKCQKGQSLGTTDNILWIEDGCTASVRVTTHSRFTPVFQFNGYYSYTPSKELQPCDVNSPHGTFRNYSCSTIFGDQMSGNISYTCNQGEWDIVSNQCYNNEHGR